MNGWLLGQNEQETTKEEQEKENRGIVLKTNRDQPWLIRTGL